MTTPNPAPIFNDLVDELTALEERFPLPEFELAKLKRRALPMQRDFPDAYYSFMGMVDSVLMDSEGVRRNFNRALQSAVSSGVLLNYLLALIMVRDHRAMLKVARDNLAAYRSDVMFQQAFFRVLLEGGAVEAAADLVASWCNQVERSDDDALSKVGLRPYWGVPTPADSKAFATALLFSDWAARTGVSEEDAVVAVQEFRAVLPKRRAGFTWRAAFVMDDDVPSLSYSVSFEGEDPNALSRYEMAAYARLSELDLPAVTEGWVVFGME
ncbi:hypothetical protein SAMN02800694_2756 [Luteibacter sp. UNCMF331Sha3.1]|uniref:hypothetical protein n=1 Tax=Luteibacter sp. UNCMF331Sha3.1 TaxID=1502760 RepID=UPI0008CCFBFD|nr:hypothetical protein [Luteibacter sp. UNCMF331Sha3.1]SEN09594.1 hypothetical protein SAMN02800694_2756 [Luteibacter sp. UNCMF331Sha3.1]